MTDLLEYRAGPTALQRVRDGVLQSEGLDAMLGAASGPRWLIAGGVDLALLDAGLLGRDRVLLAGASAGSWRMLALSTRDPHASYRALTEAYVEKAFTRADSAAAISDSYRRTLADIFTDEEAAHAVAHPHHALSICAVRGRGPTASPARRVQTVALGVAGVAHIAMAATAGLFFEPILFQSGDAHAWLAEPSVTRRPLSVDNLRAVALASGTVPLYMAPVSDVAGAPGRFIDGGMGEYHVKRAYRCERSVALFFSHQRRIIPAWFDRFAPWRQPSRAALDNLLHVYPSADFIASLPGGRVPERDDFIRFEQAQAERIANWRAAVERATALGEQLREDLDSGALQRKVRPI